MDLGLDKIISGIKVNKVNPYQTAEEESWNDVELWTISDIPLLDHVMRNVDTKVFKESVPEISVNQGSIS